MKYSAFISYSSSTNKSFTESLHKSVEKYSKKWYQSRNIRVFIDKTSLPASGDLWEEIIPYLQESNYLIYLASPEASKSLWVNKEIEWWLSNKKKANIIIILVDGELAWNHAKGNFDSIENNALPVSLVDYYQSVPLYLDLRGYNKEKFKKDKSYNVQIAALVSKITGVSKDDLVGHHVKQKKIKILVTILTLTLLLFVSFLAALYYDVSLINSANKSNAQAKSSFKEKNFNKSNFYAMSALASAPKGSVPYDDALEYFINTEPYLITLVSKQLTKFAAGGIASSPNGVHFAHSGMGSGENKIRYDISLISNAEKFALKGKYGRVWQLMFSPDNSVLYASYADGKIRAWDVYSKRIVQTYSDYNSDPKEVTILNFDISNDGRRIVYANNKNDLIIRDTKQSKLIKKINKSHKGKVFDVKFSPTGKKIFSSSSDRTFKSWDVANNYMEKELYKGSIVWTFTVNQDESKVLLGLMNGTLIVSNLKNSSLYRIGEHQGQVFSLRMIPNTNIAVSTSTIGNVRFWDLFNDKLIKELSAHNATITETAILDNGKLLVTSSADKQIKTWDISLIHKLASNNIKKFTDSDNYILFSDSDNNVFLLGKENEYDFSFKLNEEILRVDISPNENYISIKTKAGILHVYEIKQKNRIYSIPALPSFYKDYIFINGDSLILATKSEKLKHIFLKNGEIKPIKINNDNSTVSSIAYSESSNILFYADTTGHVNAFDMNVRKLISSRSVDSLDFKIESIDIKKFPEIFIGSDSTITFWNYNSGSYTKTPLESPLIKLIYSAKEDVLITIHVDGLVRIWNYKARKLEMKINLSPNKSNKISQSLNSNITLNEENQLSVFSNGLVTRYDLGLILNGYKNIPKSEWFKYNLGNNFDLYFDSKGRVKPRPTPCPPYCTSKDANPYMGENSNK